MKSTSICASALSRFALLLLALSACSSSDDATSDGGGGRLPDGGLIDGGGGGNGFSNGGTGPGIDRPLDFEECAGDAVTASGDRLDMFVTLDHTGSMGDDCPLDLNNPPMAGGGGGDNDKWCFATHALAQYFVSSSATGHRAALQYMSLEDGDCAGGPNNGAAMAAVPLSDLPVAAGHALITNLDADGPTGGLGTQIEAALRGIATYTRDHATPGRSMIGVLITDGDPNGCDEDVDNLAAILSDHLAATGIRTFIIGMTGASLDNLETLALAGGAPVHGPDFCGQGVGTCHYWSVGDGDPVAFVDALQEIQAVAVLPCEYSIPAPPPGQMLNSGLVNVSFQDGQGNTTYVPRAPAGSCDGGAAGWRYDNAVSPAKIVLCGPTCEAVTAGGSGANVQLEYGCGDCPTDVPDNLCGTPIVPPGDSNFCTENPDAPECNPQ